MIGPRSLSALAALIVISNSSYVTADPPDLASLPQLPHLTIEFAFAEDRVHLIEDGLEFVQSIGNYGVYRVTSARPRLHMPGVDAIDYDRHHTALCTTGQYFGELEGPTEEASQIRLMGVRAGSSEPETLVRDWRNGRPFAECTSVFDNRGSGGDGGAYERTYLEIVEPAPAIGSLIGLRMVGINPEGWRNRHGSAAYICCEVEGCSIDEPPRPGWPPDGGTEPPGPSTPLTSEPPGVSSPGPAADEAAGIAQCGIAALPIDDQAPAWLAFVTLVVLAARRSM